MEDEKQRRVLRRAGGGVPALTTLGCYGQRKSQVSKLVSLATDVA